MDLGISNIIQAVILIALIIIGVKLTSKFIKFIIFMAVIVIAIYFLLDTGVIHV